MTRSAVVIITTTAAFLAAGSLTEAATHARDLTGYEKAVADYTHSFQPSYVEYDAQNFVWIHWKQRRPAFLYVRLFTILDETKADITTRLYIDPLRNGSCRVRELIEADVSELRWKPASQAKPAKHVSLQFEGAALEWGRGRYLILKDSGGRPIPLLIGPNQSAGFRL